MQGVGQEVSLASLQSKIPIPEVGSMELTQELSDHIDEGIASIIAPFQTSGSRMQGRKTDAVAAGLSTLILRDPDGAYETMRAIQGEDGRGNKNKISRVADKFNVPEPVVQMLIESGRGEFGWKSKVAGALTLGAASLVGMELFEDTPDSIKAISRMATAHGEDPDGLWASYKEREQVDLANNPDMIASMLLEDYPDLTADEAAKHAQSFIAGETIKMSPKNWLANMDPYIRNEMLSLLHGGTSFGIAQKEPSMAQSLGGLAGGLAGAYLGGPGGAALGQKGGQIFGQMFGGGGEETPPGS